MGKGMLVDVSKCIACRSCQVACKQWWKLPAVPSINRGTHENPADLTAHTWNRIAFREIESDGRRNGFLPEKHVITAARRRAFGFAHPLREDTTTWVPLRSMKIGVLAVADAESTAPSECPDSAAHDISPKITVGLFTPRLVSYSCAFCKDRLENGGIPACAKACPTQAIQFGEWTDLVKRGRARVNTLKDSHPKANLYGEKEMGGLKVLKVLTEEPAVHGLPENPKMGTYPEFVKHNFPRWYRRAVTEGILPSSPQANPKWYMQPDLTPAPPPKEPALIGLLRRIQIRQMDTASGWLVRSRRHRHSFSILWSLRRRKTLGKEEQQSKKN